MTATSSAGPDARETMAAETELARGQLPATPARVGIDLTGLSRTGEEGRDQAIHNLLRGLRDLGHGGSIVAFAYSSFEERLRELLPDAQSRLFRRRRIARRLQSLRLRTIALRRAAAAAGVEVLLFPRTDTGLGRFRVPTVVVSHDLHFKSFPELYSRASMARERLQRAIEFRLRDRIVAVSDFGADEVRRHYPLQAGKVVRIHSPVLFTEPLPGEARPHPRPYVATVNIRYPHKNTLTLLRAFERIRDRIPHDLLVVGSLHSWGRSVVAFVEERRLDDRVFFTGFVPERRAQAVVRHADLYVNPSVYETFGMTAVEAMGAGTPVLSTREAALPETTLGLAAYYEPSRDDQALADAILGVLACPAEPAARERARRAVINAYDYRKVAAEYWRLLEGLAASHPRPGRA
jgi:glycosyltransferase involved in cell wall biosynthesis